jgi:hypothetical protein
MNLFTASLPSSAKSTWYGSRRKYAAITRRLSGESSATNILICGVSADFTL